jgi:putative spermidine/putrescine transport system substrate-binding protein
MTDALATALNRRLLLKYATAALGAAAIAPALRPFGAAAQDTDPWTAAPDVEKAKQQASKFVTYGIPNDWANYGEIIETGFAKLLGVTIKNEDTDMSSLEEITKFDDEKGKPNALCADIGLLWGPVAEQRGVVPPYLPPSAEALPEGYKAKTGGWVGTFAGVPAFVVNTDAITAQNLPMPATWADLLKPEFKGKIGSPGDPLASGTAQTTFLAWAYANGGDASNLKPAVDYAKQILPNYNAAAASTDLVEKGEQVLRLQYDFNCAATVNALKAKNINAKVVIPGISIFAPSAIMFNKFNTDKMDLAKVFMDYVLSDEAQLLFAKFGARPIRSVLGQLEIPAELKANWLPDADYAQVQVVQDFTSLDALKIADTWQTEVLGD